MFLQLTVRDNKKNKTIYERHIYVDFNAIDYMVRRQQPDGICYTQIFLNAREEPLVVLETPEQIVEMARDGMID